MADIINEFFSTFDYNILSWFHDLAIKCNSVLRPIAITLGKIGTMPFMVVAWLALFLFLFTKKKKEGLLIAGSIAVACIVSYIVKEIVIRPRPYDSLVDSFHLWWEYVDGPVESVYCFPSMHSAAAMACVVAMFIHSKKKGPWLLAIIYPLLMGASRLYLMVHYPSDVVGGYIVGIASGIIGYYLVKLAYYILGLIPNFFLSRFVLKGTLKKNIN